MPSYQNSAVTQSKLILGNAKIETAAYGTTVAGTWVNLGAGMFTGFQHTPTFWETQAGNAPDPIEGISSEQATFSFELIEYDASAMSPAFGGLTSVQVTTTQTVLNAGGATTLTDRAFRITNTSIISGATKTTVILVYKAHISAGVEIQFKSDNDANPIAVFPVKIEAKLDTSLTAGSQLYSITKLL